MTAVVLALAGAAAYGLSDFLGGLWSRRASMWPVALMACVGALIGAIVLAWAQPGDPRGVDFLWGALAGVGSGAGTAFLYRGLSRGRMGVVAPVSAVGAAVIPVVIGVLGGERPGSLVWLGIGLALPGVWLVSREESDPVPEQTTRSGLGDGVAAGIGFGLLFAALGQVPRAAGYWPLVANQSLSVLVVLACCLAMGGNPWPRQRLEYAGVVSGLLAALAVWCFLLATQRGLLAVSSVLVSLYPAATVVLAVLLLHERVHRPQVAGLALCAGAVTLVALG